jgi:hypothetical protein
MSARARFSAYKHWAYFEQPGFHRAEISLDDSKSRSH